jgi:hypothetical protein
MVLNVDGKVMVFSAIGVGLFLILGFGVASLTGLKGRYNDDGEGFAVAGLILAFISAIACVVAVIIYATTSQDLYTLTTAYKWEVVQMISSLLPSGG